jgi:hypothetical protein
MLVKFFAIILVIYGNTSAFAEVLDTTNPIILSKKLIKVGDCQDQQKIVPIFGLTLTYNILKSNLKYEKIDGIKSILIREMDAPAFAGVTEPTIITQTESIFFGASAEANNSAQKECNLVRETLLKQMN